MTSPGDISLRNADAADIPALIAFLYEHGVNEWNHLPEGPISAHLNRIADGAAQAVLAECAGKLTGFVSSEIGLDMARYQQDVRRTEPHGIIHEAVVHRDHVGQGIGSQLLAALVQQLAELGCREIYVGRHDENLGSAGMMCKAGFEVIDVFEDPRRTSGNRRTAISRIIVDN